jgi:hypothetical protein
LEHLDTVTPGLFDHQMPVLLSDRTVATRASASG